MSLVRWEPLREFEDAFDRYSKSLGWQSARNQELVSAGDWSPRVDISEVDSELVIKAEIPDVKKEDVKVSVENGVLTIQGERKQEKEEKGKKYHRIERSYGSFFRSFTLPDNVDEQKIEASFNNGMLNLHIPKTSEMKHKGIEVKIN
jgi:HSP20 family protein